jgi:hypothetical protein
MSCKIIIKRTKLVCDRDIVEGNKYCILHKHRDENYKKEPVQDTKNIKNRCEICGKNANYNKEELDYAIRCKEHKIKDGAVLVNIWSKKYAEIRFRNNIEKLRGVVIGEYKNCMSIVECTCVEGHQCFIKPNQVQQGYGICRICAGNDPEIAMKKFHDNIEQLGGIVIGEYIGAHMKVECKCINGHTCFPNPSSIRSGNGMCKICSKKDFETAKKNFHDNIEKLGYIIIGEYKGKDKKIECICTEGHQCFIIPNGFRDKGNACSRCSSYSSEKFIIGTMEKITERKFPKSRPKFLTYNKGKALELDGYCPELKMAIEVQGLQHFNYIPYFHRKGIVDFYEQQKRDSFKVEKCRENDIDLIVVPVNNKRTDRYRERLEEFLISELERIVEYRLKNPYKPIIVFEK